MLDATGTPSGGDHCGNVPGTPTLPSYQQSFSYDNLDRMTSGPAGTMSYDSTHVHAAASASTFPNQYASYDAMGNMTCRNVDTSSGHTCGSGQSGALMTYDNEGRLTGWTAPSGTTATDSFLYDNEGNRVLQRSNDANGLTDTITFDNYLEIVLHNGTTTTTKYYNVGGQRVAMRTGSTLYYLLNDDQGGTSLVLTSGGGVQAVQLYAPYGAVRYSQGTVPTTYNYTGQRLDSETGLLYYGFRYYDPLVGQFVRADSVETNAGGMNGYGYVGENPETRTDPTGHAILGEGGQIYHPGSPFYIQGGAAYSIHTGQLYNSNGFTNGWRPGQGPNAAAWRPRPTSNPLTLLKMCSQNAGCAAAFRDYHSRLLHAYLSAEFNIFAGVLGIAAGLFMDNPEVMQQDEEDLQQLSDVGIEGEALTSALGCSFTSETLVRTKYALQPIGKVHIGDKVLAYNPKTRKMEWQSILHVWIHTDKDLVDLTIMTATPAQHGRSATRTSEVLHTNKKHPFFTLERGFVPVGQLKLGMHVLRADGRVGVITGWKIVPGVKTMYNLEVAQDHTFTVGAGQWVVHNTCNPTDEELLAAYETAPNKDAQLEAEAGILARMYSTVLKFREPIFNPNGTKAGEVDVETPGAIIEATTSTGGKIPQVINLLTNRLVNPAGKPVIVYAPGYTQNAENALYARLGPNAPVYIARTQDELIEWTNLLPGA